MPHTIAENLTRLQNDVTASRTAIINKGGVFGLTNGLDDFADAINSIPGPDTPQNVKLVDYDGTVLHTYSKAQFAALESLPAYPTHEGLRGLTWNWSLANAKSYLNTYDDLIIGMLYTINDTSKTKIYVTLVEGRTSPTLQLYLQGETNLGIEWGDGNSEYMKNTSANPAYVSLTHEYVTPGNYVISIRRIDGSYTLKSQTTTISSILWNGSNVEASPDKAYNNSITRLEVGVGVSTIDTKAFRNCLNLRTVVLSNATTTIGEQAFYGCTSLTEFIMSSTVNTIGAEAFYGCISLKVIVLSDHLTGTSLASGTFRNCYSLKTIAFSKSVNTISSTTFLGCTSLENITLPDTITSIGSYAFSECHSLKKVVLPNSITSIDQYTFSTAYSLKTVVLSTALTTIGQMSFKDCKALESVSLPNTLTTLSANAFENCYSLKSVSLSSGLTTFGSNVFSHCTSLKTITIPGSIGIIPQYALAYCTSLESVTIESGITKVMDYAFTECTSLRSISFPNTIATIESNCFYKCSSLSSVTFGTGLTKIGNGGFQDCPSIDHIVIPSALTNLGTYVFYNAGYMSYVKFEPTTPPAIAGSSTWNGVSTSTRILVPVDSYGAYTSASNYPSSSNYTYLGFGTYTSGDTLPATTQDELYTLTWYASMADAVAETNPITEGIDEEVYARATAV